MSKRLNYGMVAAVLAITLVVLFGVNYLWQRTQLEVPLKTILGGNKAVLRYAVDKNADPAVISITLAPGADFSRVAPEIAEQIYTKVTNGIKLEFNDERNDQLKQDLASVDFFLREAQVRRTYSELLPAAEQKLQSGGARGIFTVTDDAIYVAIERDGNHLYAVYPLGKVAVQ
jgi:hypothetical protein